VVVGVNQFKSQESARPNFMRIDAAARDRQIARLSQVRAKRDPKAVETHLKRVQEVARSNENTMPVFIDAVENYVTLGEICDALRKVWGTYQEAIVF
jgi:methylmalonyl-CoA mutase N-terminal domain/subunit